MVEDRARQQEQQQVEQQTECRKKVFALEELVMGFVGKGHHLFVAGVSKEWRGLYSAAYPALITSPRHSVLGSMECLNWAVQQGCPLTTNAFRVAALWGDVIICEAFHRHGCPWDEQVCAAAALNVEHGLSILKWLRSDLPGKSPCPWDERTCEAAAGNAKHGLSILKWLRSEAPGKSPCPWDERTCTQAAVRGDGDMLTWLLSDEANAPFNETIWLEPVNLGRVEVLHTVLSQPKVRVRLQWAPEGSGWRSGAHGAAMSGNLESLRWLHENVRNLCSWEPQVCMLAVSVAKSLPTLQWLRSENVMCPWDRYCCPGTHGFGRNENHLQEIKRWIHANGHPCNCQH